MHAVMGWLGTAGGRDVVSETDLWVGYMCTGTSFLPISKCGINLLSCLINNWLAVCDCQWQLDT